MSMNFFEYSRILDRFPGKRIAVIGDLMLDVYLWGRVTRISPEAPVPVVNVRRRTCCLGGAANVMRNVSTLTARAFAFGMVGEDAAGEELLRELAAAGIDPECRLLSLRIRSNRAAALLVRLPEQKWRGVYSGVIALKGDGKFHTYRLFLGKELTAYPPVSLQTLRGELFFSPGTPGPQPALNLTVSAASLE